MGLAQLALPDAQKALGCHEQSLVIAQQLGLRRVEAMALGNLVDDAGSYEG